MLTDAWADTVGKSIAERTEAEKFEDGTLIVRVTDSVWAQHLSLQKREMISRLNKVMKTNILKDIRFRIGISRSVHGPEEEREDPSHWRSVTLSPGELLPVDRAFEGVTLPDDLRETLRRYFINQRKIRTWYFEQGHMPCESCGMPVPGKKGKEACFCCISANKG